MPFDRDPDHADLLAWFRDEPDRFPKGRRPSTATSDLARVDVTVHGRHWSGIDGARISVALLRAPYEVRRIPLQNRYLGYRGMAGVAPLPPNWAAQLQVDVATMRAWRAAVPPGPVPALAALGDWAYADTTEPIRLVPATLDPSHPQVVAFEVNLAGAVWDKGWLLLAVVLADDDPIPAASRLITEVARLVPAERRVAARSVRRASRFAEEGTRLAGMDMFDYLGGRPRFDRAWARSNIVWTGLYLDSPAPQAALGDPPGPGGHVRNGGIGATPRGSWMSAWPELFGDWGLAVIYWGQQGAGAGAGPYNLVATPPNPPNAIALANAEDAAEKADVAMVQSGAVIYLDYEDAAAPNADARMYASAFFHALAERGFRPGLYGHGIVVAPMSPPAATRVFRRDVPGLFAWNVRYRPFPPPPNAWRVRGGQIILDTAQPVVLDDPDALIRQWVQENPGAVPPAPLPPLLDAAGAVVPNPVHATFRPDFNLGFLQDPAFPERSPLPREIRTGRTAVSASFQERCAIYAVRRGYPVRASWFPGIVGPLPTLGSGRVPVQWNPFSVPVALRIPPPVVAADAADVSVAFGAADAEEPTAQRIHVLRRMPNRDWEHVTLPDTGLALDPLPGVVASARSDRSIEVFAVDDDTGFLAGARFTPRRGWGTLAPLPNGAAAGDQVRRTNRPSAVSRGPGLLDLFWVATDGLLRASASSEPGRWAAPVTIGNAVQAHPLANLAAVSRAVDRLDVFFVGALAAAPPPRDWRLCVVSWTQGGGWGAATRIDLGSAAPRGPEPMAAIAACTRTAANADAFVVGMDGALHRTTLRADGTWAPLTVATAAPAVGVGIGSIDGATCQGPDDIEVVVTGRDGNVYATQWEVLASPNFIPFQRVGTLDV